jgi:TolB protein
MVRSLKIILIAWLMIPAKVFSQVPLIAEKCLSNHPSDDRYASYAPSGNKILFESNRDGNWEIYIMDSNGKNQQRLTFDSGDDRRPSWHPGGVKILFESNRSGKNELYQLELESKKIIRLTAFEKAEPTFGSYAPDGETIATSLKESDQVSNIILLNKQGSIIRRLTKENKRSYYPKWSHHGKEIVYFSRKETDNQDDEIYRLNIETGEEHRLTHWPKHNFCPSWSKDDTKIVYVTSMETVRPEIYLMDVNGKNPLRLTNNEDGDTLPFWSPIENKILITGYRNGNFEICELEVTFAR